jgi:glycosyltransferase involved in cell wall biosynthesis
MLSQNNKISWLIPLLDIEGSGGMGNLFDKINYCANFYKTNLYIDKWSRNGEIKTAKEAKEIIESKFGEFNDNVNICLGYDNINDDSILQIATLYSTAKFVKNSSVPIKVYHIQDLEYSFFPLNSNYIEADLSYQLGLIPITFGKWMTKILMDKYGTLGAYHVDIGADPNKYYVDTNIEKVNAICCLFQPEKNRRLYSLLLDSLKILHDKIPDLKIYLYGSKTDIKLPNYLVNLGLLKDKQINELYNMCKLGVCFSPTNPSRIPFEMMAAGLPCIDVDYNIEQEICSNKELDYFNTYKYNLCCKPTAVDICKKISVLLGDEDWIDDLSETGVLFMKDRTYHNELKMFKENIDKIIKDNINR